VIFNERRGDHNAASRRSRAIRRILAWDSPRMASDLDLSGFGICRTRR
jgi:hypothetical protein